MNPKKETFFDQVGNFLEGHVDDSVHDNAGFQYVAGLETNIDENCNCKVL
ncbi:MAG: hypothetical protein J6B53_16135 [Clostridia bacterium]|nr:hypothetical protein [Clostridia bacterium]